MIPMLPKEIRDKLKEAARLPKRERLQTIDDIILYAKQKYPDHFIETFNFKTEKADHEI